MFSSERLLVCTLSLCNPRLSDQNALIKEHVPWFRDPNPKGTNPKGTKENSLKFRVWVAAFLGVG